MGTLSQWSKIDSRRFSWSLRGRSVFAGQRERTLTATELAYEERAKGRSETTPKNLAFLLGDLDRSRAGALARAKGLPRFEDQPPRACVTTVTSFGPSPRSTI